MNRPSDKKMPLRRGNGEGANENSVRSKNRFSWKESTHDLDQGL